MTQTTPLPEQRLQGKRLPPFVLPVPRQTGQRSSGSLTLTAPLPRQTVQTILASEDACPPPLQKTHRRMGSGSVTTLRPPQVGHRPNALRFSPCPLQKAQRRFAHPSCDVRTFVR